MGVDVPVQDPSLLSQDQKNQMLLCFVDGMASDKPKEIQQVSAEGMVHALSFAAENFKDENFRQRDMIMSSICNATMVDDITVLPGAVCPLHRVCPSWEGCCGGCCVRPAPRLVLYLPPPPPPPFVPHFYGCRGGRSNGLHSTAYARLRPCSTNT